METSKLPTLESVRGIIQHEATAGTGALIMTRMETGKPPVLQIAFEDLGWKRSPRLHVLPHGMHSYRVILEFGNFSRSVFDRMNAADDESHELAIALIETTVKDVAKLEYPLPINRRWELGADFRLVAISDRLPANNPEDRIRNLARNFIVPVMSALAELNGYDIVEQLVDDDLAMEGGLKISLVKRRERNPRNRLLAIKIHGTSCKVCDNDHARDFGFDRSLVQIHHLQPLSLGNAPRPYNPREDLIPLCPTCHRAAHRKRPIPYTVDELKHLRLAFGDVRHD